MRTCVLVKRDEKQPTGIEYDKLAALVEQGLTVREIAAELGRTPLTVRRWLTRHGLRTLATQRREQTQAARRSRQKTVTRICRHHGASVFVVDRAGYFRCRRCRAERVSRRRRKVKEILAAEAGGACRICGYARYIGALQFHHVDPSEKRLGFATGGVAASIDALRAEASKCVLLCSNCDAEVEAGVTPLPIQLV
jgi:predicted transcriptional regulator